MDHWCQHNEGGAGNCSRSAFVADLEVTVNCLPAYRAAANAQTKRLDVGTTPKGHCPYLVL